MPNKRVGELLLRFLFGSDVSKAIPPPVAPVVKSDPNEAKKERESYGWIEG